MLRRHRRRTRVDLRKAGLVTPAAPLKKYSADLLVSRRLPGFGHWDELGVTAEAAPRCLQWGEMSAGGRGCPRRQVAKITLSKCQCSYRRKHPTGRCVGVLSGQKRGGGFRHAPLASSQPRTVLRLLPLNVVGRSTRRRTGDDVASHQKCR